MNLVHRSQAAQRKPKKRSKKALREAKAKADPAAVSKKAPALPPPPSESEESSDQEEELAPGPRISGYAGGAFEALPAGDAAGWEAVGGSKKKATGGRMIGSGGSNSATSRGAPSQAGRAATQGKKRAEHACERPGCGALGSRGFKKCGRWAPGRSWQAGLGAAPVLHCEWPDARKRRSAAAHLPGTC